MNDNDTPGAAETATDEVAASRPAGGMALRSLPKVRPAPPARAPADAFPLDATGWGTCGWPWM